MQKTKVYIGKTVRTLLIDLNPLLPAVLRELIKIADRQNIVHLTSYRQKLILRNLRIKNADSSYVRVAILKYIKSDYLIKIAESTYMINPHCAFNCSNDEFLTLVSDYDRFRNTAYANKKRTKKQSYEQQIQKILKDK